MKWHNKILIAILLLLFSGVAYGLITNPYTVDEKSRVSFGDSTAVSGYEGLENYLYEYVGGYLHITFTYTHHNCCFSSYPPEVYITAENPTTTATPTVRSSLVAFQLLAGTHGTDWYSYDIQFDSTGYRVIVKKTGVTEIENTYYTVSGQTNTDYAALANDYTPVGNFSMSFTPRLVREAVASSGGSGSQNSNTTTRAKNDRIRCIETDKGMYCPNLQAREYYIKENMEQTLGLLLLLIKELTN
jgi:hypothetical protein